MATIDYTISISKADILKQWAAQYNCRDFIANDPVQFPHQWEKKQDIEISAFITSWLSYGQRSAIIEVARTIDKIFVEFGSPYLFIIDRYYRLYSGADSLYRFYQWNDFVILCNALNKLYSEYTDMETMILDRNPGNYLNAIIGYFSKNRGIPQNDKSACKRLNMFLRWMIRKDGIVDLGIWKELSPEKLIIPLDTHVHRVALAMGITQRKQADMKTALEITNYFKGIFPDDPALGDFALFGAGINSK